MLAGHSAPRYCTHPRQIHLRATGAEEGSISRPFSTQVLRVIPVGFTYSLQQRRRAVLAGHSAPRHCAPWRSDSLTRYNSEGGQC